MRLGVFAYMKRAPAIILSTLRYIISDLEPFVKGLKINIRGWVLRHPR